MISSKFNFFFLLLLHASLFPYNFLDRLNVPIFISSSFSSGYDTNIFRLSEFERDFEYNKKIPTINSDYFDDFYVSPKVSIKYSPYILKKDFLGIDKTQFNFSLSRTQYISTEEKSYNIIFSEFGVKFGPYNWIKIHHRMLPDYYLRNYIDQDSNSSKYSPSIFSSESFGASYSNRLGRSVWFRCKYTKTNLYYNVDFTEFDTEIK